MLGNGPEARGLPIVGMRFDALPAGAPPIYGYEAKWLWDTLEQPLDLFECPARIPKPGPADRIRRPGRLSALGCRDWCRIDVRCDAAGRRCGGAEPVARHPAGPARQLLLSQGRGAAGMSYDELIQSVAEIAWRRISGTSHSLPEAAG